MIQFKNSSFDSSKTTIPNKANIDSIRNYMKELGIESISHDDIYNNSEQRTKVSYIFKESVDRLSHANPDNVQEIAASQIQLLNNYYDLVLDQAKRSFKWALIAAGVGFVFLIASLGFILLQQRQMVAIMSLISGSLVEVISAINFYLYGRTSSQLSKFHTRLDMTQRHLLANSICECLEGDYKNQARSYLIKMMASSYNHKGNNNNKLH
jgi:hypothetical protein